MTSNERRRSTGQARPPMDWGTPVFVDPALAAAQWRAQAAEQARAAERAIVEEAARDWTAAEEAAAKRPSAGLGAINAGDMAAMPPEWEPPPPPLTREQRKKLAFAEAGLPTSVPADFVPTYPPRGEVGRDYRNPAAKGIPPMTEQELHDRISALEQKRMGRIIDWGIAFNPEAIDTYLRLDPELKRLGQEIEDLNDAYLAQQTGANQSTETDVHALDAAYTAALKPRSRLDDSSKNDLAAAGAAVYTGGAGIAENTGNLSRLSAPMGGYSGGGDIGFHHSTPPAKRFAEDPTQFMIDENMPKRDPEDNFWDRMRKITSAYQWSGVQRSYNEHRNRPYNPYQNKNSYEVTGYALNEMMEPAGEYLEKSINHFVKGNYTEDFTGLGLAAQVLTSLFGVDLPADLRDFGYDVTHWETTWAHVLQTLLDGIGLLPVIGALKYLDESGDVLKGALKHGDEAAELAQASKRGMGAADEVVTGVGKAADGAMEGAGKTGKLNWDSVVSKKGETRLDHINRHSAPNSSRATHGVFNGDPQNVVNQAWNKRSLVAPIKDGMGGEIYNIPMKNAGYESGYNNVGVAMDYVTIVVKEGTSEVIAAFPSFGNYGY